MSNNGYTSMYTTVYTTEENLQKVYIALKELEGNTIKEVNPLVMDSGIMLLLQGKTPEEIGNFIIKNIRTIEGVNETRTFSSKSK